MLLAIDTATRTLSLALHDRVRVRAELTWETENAHTVELGPAVVGLLQRVNLAPADLTRIAVAQGPGSFSGLRIGIGFAKGLALSLGLPLIAIPTLDIIAHGYPMTPTALIAVAQAGRGRVCVGRYLWKKSGWEATSAVEILAWSALIESLSQEVTIVGEIDDSGRNAIAANEAGLIHIAAPSLCVRRAAVLADMAWERSATVEEVNAVTPLYVNQPGLPHP